MEDESWLNENWKRKDRESTKDRENENTQTKLFSE